MIFQGAPGAGKIALMLECMEAVRQHSTPDDPWVAVNIKPETLVSSVGVVKVAVNAINTESERLSREISGTGARKFRGLLDIGRKLYQELSERGIGIAGVSIGGQSRSAQDAKQLAQLVFQNATGLLKNFHIVAFVDEARTLWLRTHRKNPFQ